ncbi:MAG TPA: HAD-IB family phosphatase [Candidatus Acidoferrales bacterium]|nr:HAD-IB family phosphatase [Candidatus Acidoferrales bacterium]
MPFAYLCDFDGTVSPQDIGAALVHRFSAGREPERDALLARWAGGALGHRELSIAECALLEVNEADALAFTRTFRLDRQFAPFVREALGRGDAVMIVSEGFDFYVRDQLARAGLSDLPRAANEARFEGGRVTAAFPFADAACAAGCGNCKAQHVRRYRGRGFHTVLVGDGLSDRCGARAADTVLARGALGAWCASERLACVPFEDFADVAEFARQRDLAAPLPRPSRPASRAARRS